MKKKVLILFAGIMALSLAGCGNGENSSTVTTTTASEPTASLTEAAETASDDTESNDAPDTSDSAVREEDGQKEDPLEGKPLVKIRTEGPGEIAFTEDGSEPVFDEEYPFSTGFFYVMDDGVYRIATRATEGGKFVKWTNNGEDYSSDEELTIETDEDMDLVAVYDNE